MSMSDDANAAALAASIGDYRDRLCRDSLHLIQIVFPRKVAAVERALANDPEWNVDMDAFCAESRGSFAQASSSAAAGNIKHDTASTSKKRKSVPSSTEDSASTLRDPDTGAVVIYTHHTTTHPTMLTVCESIRREVSELSTSLNQIKTWIQLSVPKIEDGNNFGVSVQEQMIEELGQVENHAFNMLESIGKYFITAKLCSKAVKYPRNEDYAQSIVNYDVRMHMSLRMSMSDICNDYAITHDRITKNLDRLTKPRGNNNAVESMY